MMFDETLSHPVGSVVTRTFRGMSCVRGSKVTAAITSVSAPGSRCWYQVTLSLPSASAFRRAGRMFHVDPGSAFRRMGASCTGVRLTRLKLWNRISAVAMRRASFQAMLTVPAGWLTAILGKSLVPGDGKCWTRFEPGTIARSIETILTACCLGVVAHGDTGCTTRQANGT